MGIGGDQAGPVALHELARGIEAGIEIDRANQSFEPISQRRNARATAARFLTAPHQQELPEFERRGVLFQRVPRNQTRP